MSELIFKLRVDECYDPHKSIDVIAPPPPPPHILNAYIQVIASLLQHHNVTVHMIWWQMG